MSVSVPPRPSKRREIYLSQAAGPTRIGIWEDGGLREVRYEDPEDEPQLLGGVFLGRVTRVVPSLQAAFVDILPGITGFLAVRDARRRIGTADAHQGPIETLCHEGEALIVQVIADADGDKGPRVSTDITFASEHLVFSPTRQGVLLSSRIHDKSSRARLKALGEDLLSSRMQDSAFGYGVILRTTAATARREFMALELDDAEAHWSAISDASASAQPRTRLDRPVDAVETCLRHFAASADAFITDGPALARRLENYLSARRLSKATVQLSASKALFEDQGLQDEIDTAMSSRVALPGGGWISIGQTEALTAIDVNTGTGRSSASPATLALRTNEEAAVAVARQVRLRGLAGLFVIDFIEMKADSHRETVRNRLIEALGLDPSPCRVGSFSEFGLLEFTRHRSGPPLSYYLGRSDRGN